MNALLNHPYRVLIVEDERRDWANPMQEALEDATKAVGLKNLRIDVAEDKFTADNLLARNNYHLTSLDMRIPERKGEPLSVTPGISLARGFPWMGFPKTLIYSQTLRNNEFAARPQDAMQVLQIQTDLYAKPSGSDDDQSSAIEVLKVGAWAQRVVNSLINDNVELEKVTNYEKRQTVIGATLHYGVAALPPFLASHLQILSNSWQMRSDDRVVSAIRFIEATARLALVQSAVLYRAQGGKMVWPIDERMISCLNSLRDIQKKLSAWNWNNYLTSEAIAAFGDALTVNDSQRHWAALRPQLQYALDVAAYWVRHPLATDLRYSRDGWSAELLMGTATPRRRHLLPLAMDFPGEAARDGVWQSVWTDGALPERKALEWDGLLKPDVKNSNVWWFPAYCDKNDRIVEIDLISGNKR
jgi:hypothetical protein